MRDSPHLPPRTLIVGAAALGLLMILLAVGWIVLVRGRSIDTLFPTPPWRALAVGVLAGGLFAAVEWQLFRRTSLLRQDVATIDRLLDLQALRGHHVVVIALLAAVPEELLFRGAFQPDIGLLPTALIFGLAHAISRQYIVYATAAGLLCGLLMQWSGTLWAPMAAHATIDAIMLVLLSRNRPPGGWDAA